MKRYILPALGLIMFVGLVASISDSLANPGRRCSDCSAIMAVVEDTDNEYLHRMMWRCSDCQRFEVEHEFKDGFERPLAIELLRSADLEIKGLQRYEKLRGDK